MATKVIAWNTGSGNITLTYQGQGNGPITVQSDDNNLYQQRSQTITVQTETGSPQKTKTVTIVQAARQHIDISTAVVTAANQTYNGSAKTPTPTVTLNGAVIPSTGYDVAYSNNTNAGIATITVTGKGDYTGIATGTFTIAQATGQVTTVPTARDVSYSGSSQYLVTAGSGTGTMYYRYKLSTSSSWSSWSTTRPSRTNAGTYNIEYYAAASSDGNYTQSATGSLNVEMKKASRTISWSSNPTSLYIGSKGTLSAIVSAGSRDGIISYSSSNSSKASVSGSTVTAVASGSCTIYASVSEGTNYLSASTSYSLTVNAVPSGYVNMGLPSGLLWAEKYIGASSIYTYNCSFFSWGNTDGHAPTSDSSFSPYYWGTSNNTEPYVSSSGAALTGNIGTSNDAARVNLGSPARMPTASEFTELFNNIKYINESGTEIPSSTTDKRSTVNGILGLYIESKINGNRLFFPCSGLAAGSVWNHRAAVATCWSSTLHSVTSVAYNLRAAATYVYPTNNTERYLGLPVRAVRN